MILSIIAATDLCWVIGNGGKLPWHLPGDLQRFKLLTMGKPVIVGRRTIEGIGRGFHGRKTIVLSRSGLCSLPGCDVASSLEEACAMAAETGAGEVMVIGGAQVYEQALAVADRIYLTIVLGAFAGDALFPNPIRCGRPWRLASTTLHRADEQNPWECIDVVLDA